MPAADALYNSALMPHAERWTLPLLPFDAVLRFLDDVLARVLERLQARTREYGAAVFRGARRLA